MADLDSRNLYPDLLLFFDVKECIAERGFEQADQHPRTECPGTTLPRASTNTSTPALS